MKTTKIWISSMLALAIALSFSVTAHASDITPAHEAIVHNADINVSGHKTDFLTVGIFLKTVSKVKICLAFKEPSDQVELVGKLKLDDSTPVWFGSTKGGCTTLEDIGKFVVTDTTYLRLQCRNFKDEPVVCHTQVVAYE